ncbi:MAG: NAD(+)/NADH kinase [Eubacteriales bacterium]|nr:NAD(+)/NADH kinase [Eubacteriales bacterium]
MKHFLVITNKEKDKDLSITNVIRQHLQDAGAICYVHNEYTKNKLKPLDVPDDTECILVIGGDGTILNAATKIIGKNIPILGINLGTLGFLAEVNVKDIHQTLDRLIADNYQIENRTMLSCEVFRDGARVESYHALNDIVLSKSGYNSVIGLSIAINETEIESYYADGLIICTPTGSTAYNLAAGGPIINPTCKNFVVTPICPHSLTTRSVVLAKDDVITIRMMGQSSGRETINPIIIYDGRLGLELYPGDEIHVYKAEEVTPFIKMTKVSFAKILRDKML